MPLTTFKTALDGVRKLSELVVAGIMTPAVAGTAAELVDAGESLTSILLTLGWLILFARLLVTVLELWEKYARQPPPSSP